MSVDTASPFAHKIRPRQRERMAFVYIRQSTQQQVLSNRESADLQYTPGIHELPSESPQSDRSSVRVGLRVERLIVSLVSLSL